MPYQYLPDTWGAAVVVSVVTLDRIIPGPGFEKFFSQGSQWNTATGLRATPMLGPLGSIMIYLVYFLLFSCLGFPEDLRKTNPAKVTRKLEIRWKENAKHSHTSVLKRKNVARHHGWCLRHLLWSRNVCSSLGNGSNGSNGSVSSWTTKKRLGVHNIFYSIITCYNITQLLIHGLEWLFNHASHASDTQASHAITSHAISEWQNGP